MALAAAALPVGVRAQQLHENIGVQGKYVREVIVQDRINTFPSRITFSLDTAPLPCSLKAVPADFQPAWTAMPLTTPFVRRDISSRRGYLDLSAGSWLDADLSAGYKILADSLWSLNAWLQHNSTSLFRPHLSPAADDVRRFRYDETLGLDLSRRFPGAGTLDAALSYHLGYFNYYGCHPAPAEIFQPSEQSSFKAPTQTLNDLALRVAWNSVRLRRSGLNYSAALSLRHFAYRDLWLPDLQTASTRYPDSKGLRETRLSLSGSVAKTWNSGSALGIDLSASALFYAGAPKSEFVIDPERTLSLSTPGDYGMVTLTPFYRFSRGKFRLRAGLDIDLAFNAGSPADRYGTFHIAPDIALDWRSGAFGLYLNLAGGSQLQTLAAMHQLDYYNMPALTSTRPVYSPLDAELGFNFGPFAGFSAGISAAYRISRDVPLGGWYMAMLNSGSSPLQTLEGIDAESFQGVAYSLDSHGISLHGVSLGARLAYEYGSILRISASATYQPQNGRNGFFNGLDRPRWTAGISAEVRPVDRLSIFASYSYRGVRRIYTRYYAADPVVTLPGTGIPVVSDRKSDPPLCSMRLPDITDLSVGASFRIRSWVRVFVQASDILNRKVLWLPATPLQGISVTGGFNFLF